MSRGEAEVDSDKDGYGCTNTDIECRTLCTLDDKCALAPRLALAPLVSVPHLHGSRNPTAGTEPECMNDNASYMCKRCLCQFSRHEQYPPYARPRDTASGQSLGGFEAFSSGGVRCVIVISPTVSTKSAAQLMKSCLSAIAVDPSLLDVYLEPARWLPALASRREKAGRVGDGR